MEHSNLANRRFSAARNFKGRSLLAVFNAVCATSILFFGYDQGVMSGVNNSKDYIDLMGIGYVEEDGHPVITDSVRQGGIVAIYYFGTLIGCLMGGWIADKIGRAKTVWIGCIWAIVGAALQCSAQNVAWMCCARLITGIGTGHLNAAVPVWAAEVADYTSRGAFIAMEFTLNICGVVIAYWLEFGLSFIDGGASAFRWRFPIAFQLIPLAILAVVVTAMPESPRYLIKVGRRADAEYILYRLRDNEEQAKAEADEIAAAVELEQGHGRENSYLRMLLGIGSGDLHTARRVQLVIWLQIIQEWVGIAAVTVYAPTIFAGAGYSATKSNLLAGVNNITYALSTVVAIYTLDVIGRRWTLYWGAVGQGIAMFLAGGFSRLTFDAAARGDAQKASAYGGAAAFFVFLYTFVFGATWLTVPWLYPTEIFPLEVRAKGNAWGVVGWSIGNGWLTLLTPVMFSAISEKTLYIFGACNFVAIPIVWAFYPEPNQRTLEEMDLLFASPSVWAWEAEKNFVRLKAEHPELARHVSLREGEERKMKEKTESAS